MNGLRIVGIVLAVVGIAALAYGGFTYTKDRDRAELGPVEISVEEKDRLSVPPLVGGAILAVGVVMIVLGVRKGRSVAAAAFLAGSLLLAPAAASAGGLGIGAHLGYAKADGAEDGNGLVGGHLELRPASWLGIVGAVDYRLVETYRMDVNEVSGELDVRSVPVTVSGRLYVPLMPLSLFATAGAGWYYLIYDYSDEIEALGIEDDTESTFGWHLGGGVDLQVSPMVSLFGEGRAVFLDPDRSLDDEIVDRATEFDYDSTYFSAGATLHFR